MVSVPRQPQIQGFDVIGDVHGCANSLRQLLDKLGYSKRAGVYQHARRQAIFLGDIIDRGPRIREALHLVRDMVERGSAQLLLGNHELNALAYHTPVPSERPDGSSDLSCDSNLPCDSSRASATGYLRAHTPSHNRQIAETLQQFANYPNEWAAFRQWFMTLPLFGQWRHPGTGQLFRAVHACWDAPLIDAHRVGYGEGINAQFLTRAYRQDTLESLVRRRLTSGVDLPLPEGMSMRSSDGYIRRAFRAKFWDNPATTYAELLFQPDPLPEAVANMTISAQHRAQIASYPRAAPPLFVGHYWLTGRPQPLADNLACVDYSAVKFGRLAAYQMDGEAQLLASKFVWVDVEPY